MSVQGLWDADAETNFRSRRDLSGRRVRIEGESERALDSAVGLTPVTGDKEGRGKPCSSEKTSAGPMGSPRAKTAHDSNLRSGKVAQH